MDRLFGKCQQAVFVIPGQTTLPALLAKVPPDYKTATGSCGRQCEVASDRFVELHLAETGFR
jgi:hypothetical protein